ncbi:AAA ATPase [Burkholderia sp. MR1]|nr:AAA ATPase [Burkholderia sp. MR1]
MRQARAGDVWGAAIKRHAGSIVLRSLTTSNVRGIGDITVAFSSPLTAICGENGAGKTTLLKTLYAALVGAQAQAEGINLRPQDAAKPATAHVTIGYLESGKPADDRRDLVDVEGLATVGLGNDDKPQVLYLDAARASQRVRFLVEHDHDFTTALEGAPNAEDSAELLRLRREITGRGYASAQVYELEDYADEPVFPYFRVVSGKSTYCSEDMGLGELCVNHTIWAMERIREDSIVLLEEPESHLPPRAQVALMNYIAACSVRKRLTIVVSTHSSHTMARLPRANVTLLARNGERFICTPNPLRSVLYETLHILPTKIALVIAEDRSAAAMIAGIVRAYDEALLEKLEVGWVNGFGDVDEILKRKPIGVSKIALVGVYDGDQRALKGSGPSHLFLPGDDDPAHDLAAAVKASPEKYATCFPDEVVGAIEVALAHCAESDPKDYFLDIKKNLDEATDIGSLYRCAVNIWLSVPSNAQMARKFAVELKEKLGL